jgi:hypothetical protein
LLLAAEEGHKEVVSVLLEKGAWVRQYVHNPYRIHRCFNLNLNVFRLSSLFGLASSLEIPCFTALRKEAGAVAIVDGGWRGRERSCKWSC